MKSKDSQDTSSVSSTEFIAFEKVVSLNGIKKTANQYPSIPYNLQREKISRTCNVNTKGEYCQETVIRNIEMKYCSFI